MSVGRKPDRDRLKKGKKVVLCVPTILKPSKATLASVEASIPILEADGWQHAMVSEVGNPYISAARSYMLHKALHADATAIVFIDHDISWDAQDLLKLINTKDEVVAGVYRYKSDAEEEYMGHHEQTLEGRPLVREDGCISMVCVPAGFLKVTDQAINVFIEKYPELCYANRYAPHVDLFNHGARDYTWFGEDYSFCHRWKSIGRHIWCIPNMNIDHHHGEPDTDGYRVFKGNYHQWLMRQSGGSKSANPIKPKGVKNG